MVRKILLIILFAAMPLTITARNLIHISPEEALAIGVKIWYNEGAGTVAGLTTWSAGENFASLGIGHFIWYPYGVPQLYSDSFPDLLQYLQAHGANVPIWLQGNWQPYCPWNNRQEFQAAQNSTHMLELRQFLLDTIPLQTEFMIERMEEALPKMLASLPEADRPYIRAQFYQIASTPLGVYALVDYVNFKGIGVTASGRYDYSGWGLLEVLESMRYAPENMSTLQAFVWSANQVLTRRVMNQPYDSHEWLWLNGWRNRLQTYLG